MAKRFYMTAGVAAIFLAAVMLAETFLSPFVPGIREAAAIAVADTAAVNAIYGAPPAAPPTLSAHAAAYIPRYEPTDRTAADAIAAAFGVGEMLETDDDYIYICANGILTISKHFNRIAFRAGDDAVEAPFSLGAFDAEAYAAAFLTAYGLSAPYARALAEEEREVITVLFLSRLGGADCLAFPAMVTLTHDGALLAFEVYTFAVDRLSACKLRSFSAAYAELPVDFPPGTAIALSRTTIVYDLKDSILQPSYLFEGAFSTGESFRHIVPAATFSQ